MIAAPCAQVTEASTVVLACSACPLVKLDDKHYKLVDKMEALVRAPPSLRAAKSLTVKGPVRFVQGTSIEGDCLVVNGALCPRALAPHRKQLQRLCLSCWEPCMPHPSLRHTGGNNQRHQRWSCHAACAEGGSM